jgi:cytochrome c
MDGFEFNKVMMALLLVGATTLGGNILANDMIFKAEKPKQPGFAVAVAAPAPAGGAAAAAAAAPEKPIAEVMANANAANGQAVFRQCQACHNAAKGGPNGAGPNLYGVVNRPHGTHAGFNYSAAMKGKSSEPWSFEALFKFVGSPRTAVPGTTMSFAGIRSEQQRADLLAYLAQQADTPVELPK